jgi:hypothetical protein
MSPRDKVLANASMIEGTTMIGPQPFKDIIYDSASGKYFKDVEELYNYYGV